jgi:hypothetical protein
VKGERRLISQIDIGDRTVHLVESLARIDLDNLHEEVETTGEVALWWGNFSAQAKRRAADFKLALEILEAQLSLEKRQQILKQGEKITEDFVKNLLRTDPRYAEASRAYLDAQEAADKIESAKFTIARKQENLSALTPLLFPEEGARRVGERVSAALPVATTHAPTTRTPVRPGKP